MRGVRCRGRALWTRPVRGSMSAARAKKVKMATKSCPRCDQQVPVACKSCPCGYIFISRKLLHGRQMERVPPTSENRSDPKRRRTERIRRERTNSTASRDSENRRRSRSNSQSDQIRRGRGRPKTAATKKQEEEKGRSGKDSGAEGTAARYAEDVRAQRGDRGSRRQQWMGEEKQEKEVDMYANLSDEKAFVFSVALAEINRKIINQRLIL
ncbi:UPF0547 protein C16orf87 homolog isoform X2 [Bufo gargarizans]|uniref:UPF0547 protein C16orf87 homolog isoform X2 n=2 Tax=Bufo TaxID=8383 RepID=UPI001CF529AB|nr:UPF0547 protein C16orf87 homolog isoform X2 [Bufo gargarizans]